MKKVFLLLSALLFLLNSCNQEGEKNVAENASPLNEATTEPSVKKQKFQKKSVNADVKTALMEEGSVLFASDDMTFEAIGDWTAEDSRAFYKNCNEISVGKRANPNLNLDKYCSCLKTVMLDNNYGPRQMNRAVKNEQVSVMDCLKGSIIKDE